MVIKKLTLLLALMQIAFVCAFCLSFQNLNVSKVQATVETKSVENGKSIKILYDIFYQSSGDCISHYTKPLEKYVLTNKFGEVKIYDPTNLTVITQQDKQYSSQTSMLYYFLNGKQKEMGLPDFGYSIKSTKVDKGNIITEWEQQTPQLQNLVSKIKLVHKDSKPIYMEYKNAQEQVLRKVYYYSYNFIGKANFPFVTTDITFNLKSKDSTVTKTTYGNIKINEQANGSDFNFKIPNNAKKIN